MMSGFSNIILLKIPSRYGLGISSNSVIRLGSPVLINPVLELINNPAICV